MLSLSFQDDEMKLSIGFKWSVNCFLFGGGMLLNGVQETLGEIKLFFLFSSVVQKNL